MMPSTVTGVLLALGGFIIWGLFPLYWKLLVHVNAFEVLSHRVLWSVPFIGIVIFISQRGTELFTTLRQPKRLGVLTLSAMLISLNWGVYIWAISVDKVVEASMGYYLTPLLNVVIGVAVFGEHMARIQKIAVAIAIAGVLYLFVTKGVAPWVALILGISFAAYGALRKHAVQDSVTGLFLEALLISPLAIGYVAWLASNHASAFLAGPMSTTLLLAGAGVVTATPLMLFVAGAKRLHYATVGLLFYLTPSIQFLIGTFIFHEPLDSSDLVAFGCIWLALVLFASHGTITSRGQRD
ncbi:MAG: chloramphenicol resistance permease RarD [marine bacterium B5-7]|nr:MAG: chloramphenicol resistance permease RarD [marine bacterium B5-7]